MSPGVTLIAHKTLARLHAGEKAHLAALRLQKKAQAQWEAEKVFKDLWERRREGRLVIHRSAH